MAIGRRIGAWLGYWTSVPRVVVLGRRIGSWIGYWQAIPPTHFITDLWDTSVSPLAQLRAIEAQGNRREAVGQRGARTVELDEE